MLRSEITQEVVHYKVYQKELRHHWLWCLFVGGSNVIRKMITLAALVLDLLSTAHTLRYDRQSEPAGQSFCHFAHSILTYPEPFHLRETFNRAILRAGSLTFNLLPFYDGVGITFF